MESMPAPLPDEVSLPYWEAARSGRLVVQVCQYCGNSQFPPDLLCHACLATDLGYEDSTGLGRLYSYAIYTKSFDASFEAPYVLALVDLVDHPGVRLMTNVVDTPLDELAPGMALEVTFEERGEWWLPQFRKAAAS